MAQSVSVAGGESSSSSSMRAGPSRVIYLPARRPPGPSGGKFPPWDRSGARVADGGPAVIVVRAALLIIAQIFCAYRGCAPIATRDARTCVTPPSHHHAITRGESPDAIRFDRRRDLGVPRRLASCLRVAAAGPNRILRSNLHEQKAVLLRIGPYESLRCSV